MRSYLLQTLVFFCPVFSLFGTNLIVNGDFETGNLSGWTRVTQSESEGHWIVYSGDTLPLSGNAFYPPPQGTYAAAFDQQGPSSSVLYQDVAIPVSATLQFTYYYENYAPVAIPNPDTLDYSYPPANQQFRIDLMTPTSDPFSVAPSDVLENLVQLLPGDPDSLSPTTVTFDVSQFAGQTVRLRFAAVDNQNYLNVGVDAVSILAPGPGQLSAKVLKNQFLTLGALVNQLTWKPPALPNILYYLIYRNGELIGSVPASGPLVYNDPSCVGIGPTTYTVVAVTTAGLSGSTSITIPKG